MNTWQMIYSDVLSSSFVAGWLKEALLYGTVLAALTWLATRVLRKRIPAALQATLWSIVLIKFLTPIGPGWSFSLATLFEKVALTPARLAHSPAPTTDADAELDALLAATASPEARPAGVAVAARAPIAWPSWLAALYVVGVAGYTCRRIVKYRQFRARCMSFEPADRATQDLVRRVCRDLGSRRVPLVRISDNPPAPFVMGMFRPLLVLSPRHFARPAELETVVVHEVAHLRRGDVIVRQLQWVAGTLLFFWPVVSWVNRRIDAAREHACDDWALSHGRLSPGEYARCVLNAINPGFHGSGAYCPAAMAVNPDIVERRIEMILASPTGKKCRRRIGVPVAALVLCWSGFVLTGAAAEAPPESEEQSSGHFGVIQVAEETPHAVAVVREAADDEHGTLRAVHTKILIEKLRAHRIALAKFHSEKAQAAFAEEHPTADVDEDGKVSKTERGAFLTALAMTDPDAVLERFPKADKNDDGALDDVEAARLVARPTGGIVRRLRLADESFVVRSDGAAEDGDVHFTVTPTDVHVGEFRSIDVQEVDKSIVQQDADRTVKAIYRVLAPTKDTEVVQSDYVEHVATSFRVRVRTGSPEDWLLKNIAEEPTYDEVEYHVESVALARDAEILERHPDADLDGDGLLTDDERAALHDSLLHQAHEGALHRIMATDAVHEAHPVGAKHGMLKLHRTLKEFHEHKRQEKEDNR